MTGKGILEALSFVDEKYIEEAESGILRSQVSPLVKLLPLAACLCAALLGLFPRKETGASSKQQNLGDTAMQQTVQEELAGQEPPGAVYGEADISLDEAEMPHVSEVPMLILRIDDWTAEGFTATVEECLDSAALEPGVQVRVEFVDSISVESVSGELVTAERRSPTEADFPVGTLVVVRYASIADDGTRIRIKSITLAEP